MYQSPLNCFLPQAPLFFEGALQFELSHILLQIKSAPLGRPSDLFVIWPASPWAKSLNSRVEGRDRHTSLLPALGAGGGGSLRSSWLTNPSMDTLLFRQGRGQLWFQYFPCTTPKVEPLSIGTKPLSIRTGQKKEPQSLGHSCLHNEYLGREWEHVSTLPLPRGCYNPQTGSWREGEPVVHGHLLSCWAGME